ncbi:MAG: methyltransferase [Planctomycetes bacterium]|nr:methyltransferase [Planctomycetota bacterium]
MTAPAPADSLLPLISGYWLSQSVYAAAKLGLADLLADRPRNVAQLATATNTKPDFLFRLLRALASVGVFAESESQVFRLTPMAELLRSGVPGSQRSLAIMMGEEHYAVYGQLYHVLHTGENAFERVYRKPVFDFLSEHPEQASIFDDAMTGIHGRETAAVLDAYDFSGISVLADIGGGNGSKLTAILQRHEPLRGILFDLAHVLERAKPRVEAAGVGGRCQLVAGSFFEAVPTGADAYLMRHIIHDWDDAKSLTILRNCHRVMQPGHKLLLVEAVIPAGNTPFHTKLLDLTMMLIPGGKERTEAEYRTLYEQAGFELNRIVRTATEISVIEGIRR